ncbi:hypothetical protein [Muricoccus radiodurans]|uniref:hypothetical protein n=1 Tax=Muricoccus radiodurans TaxID=2231721 RepID=UPI003CEB7D21
MKGLAIALLAAAALGVVATFGYAIAGDTPMATRLAGATCSAAVLGLILFNRNRP